MTVADLDLPEINQSPNQLPADQVAGATPEGSPAVPTQQVAQADKPKSVVSTTPKAYDPLANITITRGTAQTPYRVIRR